jgi:hypothetical protein
MLFFKIAAKASDQQGMTRYIQILPHGKFIASNEHEAQICTQLIVQFEQNQPT